MTPCRSPPTPPTAARSRPPSPSSSRGCAAGCTPAPSRWPWLPASSWSRSRRRTKARVAAAVFALTAALLFGTSARLPPGHVVAAAGGRPQAPGPLQHLPDHRRHLHAVRAAAAARGGSPARCCSSSGPAPSAGVALPRLLGRSAALALHPDLPRARLGRRLLPPRPLYRGGGAAVVTLIAVGGAALHRSARSSTAPSGPTRHRAGSASTRSSTRSRWPRSSSTTSPSRWPSTATPARPEPRLTAGRAGEPDLAEPPGLRETASQNHQVCG